MEKFETQTVRKSVDWGYGACYTDLKYYHPICAMKEYVGLQDFASHVRYAYSKDLTAESFKEVYDSRQWMNYTANYIRAPFEIFTSLRLKDGDQLTFLEEVFTGIIFDMVMKPVH